MDKFFWRLHGFGLLALTGVAVLFPVLPEMRGSKQLILGLLAGYWVLYAILWRTYRCVRPA